MTAFHHYELLCDADGCDATFNAGEARASVTREKAARVGWIHIWEPGGFANGRTKLNVDYCGAHAPPTPQGGR